MRRSMLAGVAALLGVLAVSAASANAKTGYLNLCPSLKTALCNGGWGTWGVAIDGSSGPSAGDVWVAYQVEGESTRLVEFGESGIQLAEAELGGRREGFSKQVAVDPTSGAVYLATRGAVTKFDSSGVFQLQITETARGSIAPLGLAVGAEGDLYVEDVAQEAIDKFSSSGEYLGQFSVPGLANRFYGYLAMGPEGNLYVGLGEPYAGLSGKLHGEVKEYTPSGAPVDCPGGGNSLSLSSAGGFAPVAVDSNGHIFVGESGVIAEYSSLCGPQTAVLNAEGSPLGIAVNSSSHNVFTDLESQAGVRIFSRVVTPTVTTGTPATGITLTSAVVSGTVDPEGAEIKTCEFEYGPTSALGSTKPCSLEPPFAGPVTVSAEITFPRLSPGSAIYYRLKTGGAFGEETGEDETIVRAAPPTIVGGLPASSVSQFAATLHGTIETGEEVANYHFEYGTTTAYGSIAPIPDNYTPATEEQLTLSQPIVGLQAGTTYHYRLLASSPGGTNVAGPDETFTTLPIPVPAVATGGASGVGVGSATLNGTIDPHGWDTTYLFEYGTSTAYGQSWPTVQVDMGALEGSQPVVVNVPNLLPGTTYHYRLVATNGGGTTYGPDMTFTTGEYPAQVIQEPVALRTLLVPSGGETAKPSSKHRKKAKKHKKSSLRSRPGKKGKKAANKSHRGPVHSGLHQGA